MSDQIDVDRLEVREVDPFDDRMLEAWHAAYWASSREGLGDSAQAWTLPELRVEMRTESPQRWKQGVVGLIDGEVVASGFVSTPLHDNLDSASLEVHVPPQHRRQGIGSRLLAHLEDVARGRGRTLVDSEAQWPYELGTDGAGWNGVEFGRRHGYRVVLSDVQRALDLPVDEALLTELATEAAERHADYELRSWVGPVPDELAESWVALNASLMTEAPTGERELEPERSDVATLRSNEAILEGQQRIRYHAVALAPDGEVVAYTDFVTPGHEPGKAYQWGTLVRRDHRGHRLGLAVKVANLQLLQRERDDIRRLTTWNAEVNSHMIGVNERLGFRPVGRLGEMQKRL